jgi:23S rRNA (pseudouridine1915-N3)-methyltransferase
MRITVVAVGRARDAPEQEICALQWERATVLGRKLGFSQLDFVTVDTSRGSDAASRMDEEAKRLSSRVPPASHRIALDEAGRSLSSEALAKHLAVLRDRGGRDLAFLIGGPDGLAASLREGADERLAFGSQTWPHLLVRAMLAEQVYRAFTILSGHPYHRGRTN